MNLRTIKAVVVGSIALFFTLVAFNNLSDFETNRGYIMRVLTMDTVPSNPNIAWRAIASPPIHLSVYGLFILVEIAAAVLCWAGSIQMFLQRDSLLFERARRLAILGLTLGFLEYMIGFVDMGVNGFIFGNLT